MAFTMTSCPEPGCGAPAEILEEELWSSTQGEMFMAKVHGACGHKFLMPAWQLDLGEVFTIDDTGRHVPLA